MVAFDQAFVPLTSFAALGEPSNMWTLTIGAPEIIDVLPCNRNFVLTGWERVQGDRCC